VGLAQLVRFLVVKLIYSGSNLRFDMCIIFTANYFFNERRRPCRQRDISLIDFANLKILSILKVITGVECTCMYLYCISQKKHLPYFIKKEPTNRKINTFFINNATPGSNRVGHPSKWTYYRTE
jgi:hypothetical protein